MGGWPTKEKEIEIADRQVRVAAYLRAGHSYRQIAIALKTNDGITASLGTIASDVADILTELKEQAIDDLSHARALEGARLDCLQAAIWQRGIDGELAAIDSIKRIMERRAKLFGLDAPQQLQIDAAAELPLEDLVAAAKEILDRQSGQTGDRHPAGTGAPERSESG